MSSGWGQSLTSASPGPSGDNTVYTEERTLGPADISAQQITLFAVPTAAAETTVTPIGGTEQKYSDDYLVSGQILSWAGRGLASLLDVGDTLVVTYPVLV